MVRPEIVAVTFCRDRSDGEDLHGVAAADGHARGRAGDRRRPGGVGQFERARRSVIVCAVVKTVGSKVIVGVPAD